MPPGVTLPRPPASNSLVPSTTQPSAPNRELAYLLLRLTLGVNILMHGLARILSGLAPFAAGMTKQFASTPLPAPLVHAFALALPWSELAIGLAILLGLWTRTALVLGAIEIVVLTFGIALTQNWSVAGIQIVYALVYAILLAFAEYNRWSVDRWRARQPCPRPPH
jgi:thiosulfate dehydrogenase [quinone] large subunit